MSKAGSANDTQAASELSLHNAVFLAPPSHIFAIVDMVLEAREAKTVSTSAEQQFAAAVKASGISLPKFEKRPHLAPISQLFTPVCDQMILFDQLSGSVFRIWAEGQKDLRVSVEDYARSNGLPVEGPDYKNRRFRDWMPLKTWNSAIGGITGDSDDFHSREDISIMLCMVTGQLPGLVEQVVWVDDPAGADLPFDGWLEELKTLLSSPAGPVAAARFVNTASQMVEDRQYEEEKIADLIAKSSDLCRVYMQELVFLGRELPATLSDPRRIFAGQAEELDDALNVVDELGEALEEFRAALLVDYGTWELRQKGMKKEMEAASKVHSLIERIHDVLPEPVEEPEPEVEAVPLTDDTTAETNVHCTGCRDLESENKALRATLFGANQRIQALRDANDDADSSDTEPVKNVREAVERAQQRFAWTEMFFYPNGAWNIDTEFDRPEEVLDALTWLATTYRDGKMKGGMADPEHSLKLACSRWKYAAGNSEMAMSQYPEAYSTKAPSGKTYTLAHHLKSGVDNEERHMIRIAFDWDQEQKMVVVGYIGKHQPSDY